MPIYLGRLHLHTSAHCIPCFVITGSSWTSYCKEQVHLTQLPRMLSASTVGLKSSASSFAAALLIIFPCLSFYFIISYVLLLLNSFFDSILFSSYHVAFFSHSFFAYFYISILPVDFNPIFTYCLLLYYLCFFLCSLCILLFSGLFRIMRRR